MIYLASEKKQSLSFYIDESDERIEAFRVKEAVKKLKERTENAQEDYANLDWISKEQMIRIIEEEFGDKLVEKPVDLSGKGK